MRIAFVAIVLAGSLALVPAATTSTQKSSFAFGRSGGNIMPASYTITRAGDVKGVHGTATQTHVTAAKRAQLVQIAKDAKFWSMPKQVNCPRTLPDIAANWIKVELNGKTRTVTVHGGCKANFNKLYKALSQAVGAYTG